MDADAAAVVGVAAGNNARAKAVLDGYLDADFIIAVEVEHAAFFVAAVPVGIAIDFLAVQVDGDASPHLEHHVVAFCNDVAGKRNRVVILVVKRRLQIFPAAHLFVCLRALMVELSIFLNHQLIGSACVVAEVVDCALGRGRLAFQPVRYRVTKGVLGSDVQLGRIRKLVDDRDGVALVLAQQDVPSRGGGVGHHDRGALHVERGAAAMVNASAFLVCPVED